jgi:hypothetical protein
LKFTGNFQSTMPFEPGKSGNPAGKPKGARDRRTALRGLLEPHAKKLASKVVQMALDGDMAAARIIFDRIMPPLRATDAPIHLDGMTGTPTEMSVQVLKAMASGVLTPDQATAILTAMNKQMEIIAVDDLARRVAMLEQSMKDSGRAQP